MLSYKLDFSSSVIMLSFGKSSHTICFKFQISLSTVVLNSGDWSEIVWLPKNSMLYQLCNRLYLKKPTGMHWLSYNDAVFG